MISRRTSSVPKEDVSPSLLYSDSRCSQASHRRSLPCCRHSQSCHRCSQVLPGAPEDECIGPANTAIWPPCDSGPTTLKHSQRLQVTKLHLADVYGVSAYLAQRTNCGFWCSAMACNSSFRIIWWHQSSTLWTGTCWIQVNTQLYPCVKAHTPTPVCGPMIWRHSCTREQVRIYEVYGGMIFHTNQIAAATRCIHWRVPRLKTCVAVTPWMILCYTTWASCMPVNKVPNLYIELYQQIKGAIGAN